MPPRRGDDGYGDWCLAEMGAGRCTCQGCSGQLVDKVCAACGCRHFVQVQGRSRYAAVIPAYDRCPDAQRSLHEWKRQQEQDHRKRRRAEALSDDPQR